MTKTHVLTVEPMTEESFAGFGDLWYAREMPGDHRILFPTGYSHDGHSTVHVIWQPQEGRTFNELERHFGVTQSFIQLSGAPAVVCAALPTDLDDPNDIPAPGDVRAFLVDPEKGYSFKRGTWHSLNRHILKSPGATFLILNSSPNPTQLVNYETGAGTLSRDLDVDPAPKSLEHAAASGIAFEIST